MFGATFLVALSYMIHARLEARFDTIPARILVMLLAFAQPLVRGWARYYTWLRFKRTPGSVIMAPHEHETSFARRFSMTRRRYWNEAGVGREALITEIVAALETEGWRYSTDTGWKPWDIQVYGNLWWNLRLRTVTEYHGGPKCLTRTRLTYHPVVTTVLLNLIFVPILLYRQFLAQTPLHDYGWLAAYVLFLVFIYYRGFRLKLRVADLVETAAHKCGLTRIMDRPRPAPPASPVPAEAADDREVGSGGTVTSVSTQPS